MPDHRFASAFAMDRNPTEAFDAVGNIPGCSSREIEARTVAIPHRTDATPGPRPDAMTRGNTAAMAAVLTAALGLAAASWVVAVWQMNGMDMGAATELGSFGFLAALWVSMMAAMMLPGAAPAVVRHVHASGRVLSVPRRFRGRCRESVRSGFEFGFCCVGSSIGLMLMLVALGVMSVTWMSMIAVVVLAHKLLPAKAAIDVPLAIAIVGLGIWIVLAPSSVPGLMPLM